MKYRKIHPRIWNDMKFNSLSDKGKLVFFFLLTHPHMTPLGAMRGSIPGFAAELGWPEKAFREAFQQVLSKGMVKHDEKAFFVRLPKFLKHNSPESPNVIKAWSKCIEDIPECDEKALMMQEAEGYVKDLSKGFREAFREGVGKAMRNQEQEQEQEQDIKRDTNVSLSSTKNVDGLPPINNGCPHKDILTLYHETLPMLPTVRVWHKTNGEKYLKARWKEKPEYRELDWWRSFFEYIADSDFLCGRKKDFAANLTWIVTKGNFEKILNGHYENRKNKDSGIEQWMRIRRQKGGDDAR